MTNPLTTFTTPALGLGCWAIGGPFYSDGTPVGWGEVDDSVSTRAIHLAVERGIKLFDTAQAYGTGHSETVLGAALSSYRDVAIVTKFGLGIDPATKSLTGVITNPIAIADSITASCKRLKRDHIDLVLLHVNDMAIDTAAPIFDHLDTLCAMGQIGAYGWSTDFPDRTRAFADRPNFRAVEHAMNVFFAAEHMVPAVQDTGLIGLIRSPLAMGILGGKYDGTAQFAKNDVRSNDHDWMGYFKDGKIAPAFLERLSAIRDILTSADRTLAQGALAWLWARSDRALPIPGFRTPDQVADLCGALDHGPLTPAQMAEIEALMNRPEEGPPAPR